VHLASPLQFLLTLCNQQSADDNAHPDVLAQRLLKQHQATRGAAKVNK